MTDPRKTRGAEHVLERLRDAPPVRERLRALAQGKLSPSSTSRSLAQAFIAAIVAAAARQRCWIICENARAQETVFNELQTGFPIPPSSPKRKSPSAKTCCRTPR